MYSYNNLIQSSDCDDSGNANEKLPVAVKSLLNSIHVKHASVNFFQL